MFNYYEQILINKRHQQDLHDAVRNARLSMLADEPKPKTFGLRVLAYLKHKLAWVGEVLKPHHGEQTSLKKSPSFFPSQR